MAAQRTLQTLLVGLHAFFGLVTINFPKKFHLVSIALLSDAAVTLVGLIFTAEHAKGHLVCMAITIVLAFFAQLQLAERKIDRAAEQAARLAEEEHLIQEGSLEEIIAE